jgi:hypothetical protein
VAPVRYLKWRLVLFFVLETLAIAMMIVLLLRSGEAHCWSRSHHPELCPEPRSVGLLGAVPLILAELAVFASALRSDQPVWGLLLMLGIIMPVFGVGMIATVPMFGPGRVVAVLALWHAGAGLLLFGAGAIGGFHAAVARRRLAHERRAQSLASGQI